jgi:hypothetical protein
MQYLSGLLCRERYRRAEIKLRGREVVTDWPVVSCISNQKARFIELA